MTPPTLSAKVERFPVAGAFTISRGAKTHVDVVTCHADREGVTGRGEGTPIYYHGETAEYCADTIRALPPIATREELLAALPRGAARNAVDAALWDLEAKQSGRRVWQMLGLPQPRPMLTAYTISVGEPEVMEAAARRAATRELLKVKLTGEGDEERIAAVRAGAPDARLIVDANEAWADLDVEMMAHALVPYRVELIEQPLPAGADGDLEYVRSPIPLCADESCQDLATLDACLGRYQLINIKLDKAGGLTEAMQLAEAAKAAGMGIMTGCMLCTSLGIAPAFHVATLGQYADLDGPLLLARDREDGLTFSGSDVEPPSAELWG